ncbi:hypothetical protein Zm00014a_035103 [Zea mays]|uniref:Electron transporter n=1 Tax=Zea mays TaxID=4577 RepID=A0A3L6EPU7_MAIZE|nr:hypothetical protein Zm00014a_035103 [Zea mays]PWZ23090.1 hypothetical protein Zm00014a_035103 [Zea mays]PWZ23091.1 hypothetical protein Zm00014a_035103 [Zea mays]PWZ23092.1 hypothetical protein Zm00014a_035103 [Zea mays]
MEVEALEKGYTAFAKAVKSFTSSERYKRSESRSYFEDMYGTDALRSSDKTIVLPMPEAVKAKVKSDISKEAQPGRGAQSTLRKEILQLEKHFREQQIVSGALENALGPNAGTVNFSPENPMPKAANELIREIATLELEVKNMEQYLLTLYRKAFEQQAPALSPPDCREASKPSVSSCSGQLRETPVAAKSCKSGGDVALRSSYPPPAHKKLNDPLADCCTSARSADRAVDSGVLRCQSALSYSYRGVCSSRVLPSEEDDSLARALRSCHSQPFSFADEGEGAGASGAISLAEYLGTNVADHIPETPNNLSEEMVRCMAGIYCRLADPPLVHHGSSSSPTLSFSSTTSAVSPQYVGDDMWSPSYRRREATTLDSRLINPFHVEGLKEFSGPYNAMVEVPTISRDDRRMKEAEDLLQTYRLVLYRMEAVDLRRMTNEERLAFWVNVHNALLMHAYLENGVPQNKTSLLAKAACKIAGRSINAAVIQSVVLGCNTHCPGQWLRRTLLYPRTRSKSKVSKAGHEWRAFAVAQPEPLLRFALCSGSHSDPAVRVYTPKRLFQQLEAAKEEFIRATAGVWKEQKLLLPKLVEAYAKDVRLSPQGLVDMVQRHLPESMRVAVQRCQQRGRASSGKVVDWVPYNPAFRYLLTRDLAFLHLN